jgi:predicted site-specific integrase-resolvase
MNTTEVSQRTLVVTERDAAKMLSVSPAALRRWRREGRGPGFCRVERLIRYRIADLEAYLASVAQSRGGAE